MTAHWAPTRGLSRSCHQDAYSCRRAGGCQRRSRWPDGRYEEARHDGSRRAVVGRNRLAARADANAASRSRARRTPAGDSGHVFRRRRVIGVAGTLHAVPTCHRAGAKILAAGPWARGQSHDAQAFDRGALWKARHFPPEAGREGRLMPSAMNPPEGRHVAAERVEMMRRNRLTQQNFTRSRTCVYFWFRARVT